MTYQAVDNARKLLTAAACTSAKLLLLGCTILSLPVNAETNTGADQNPGTDALAKQLSDKIEQFETQQGAYSLQLGEALRALGDHQFEQQDFEQAAKHYNRALHIERINQGIYSTQQKPLLRKLVKSLQAQNKWGPAIKKQQYSHWLSNRQHAQDSLELLAELDALANWHIQAYVETDKSNHQHLIEAHKLYRQFIELNDSHHDSNDLRLIPVLQGFMNTNYFLASSVEQQETGFNLQFNSREQAVERQAKIDQYKMTSFRKGKLALERMIQIYANNDLSNTDNEIKTLITLGDWYQLYGKTQSAKLSYLKAYQKAQEHSQNGESLFAKPVALPALDKSLYKNDHKHNSHTVARFDVVSNGTAKNIEILEVFPEKGKRLSSKTKLFLRSTRFRPVVKAGKLVTAEAVVQRYSFP